MPCCLKLGQLDGQLILMCLVCKAQLLCKWGCACNNLCLASGARVLGNDVHTSAAPRFVVLCQGEGVVRVLGTCGSMPLWLLSVSLSVRVDVVVPAGLEAVCSAARLRALFTHYARLCCAHILVGFLQAHLSWGVNCFCCSSIFWAMSLRYCGVWLCGAQPCCQHSPALEFEIVGA